MNSLLVLLAIGFVSLPNPFKKMHEMQKNIIESNRHYSVSQHRNPWTWNFLDIEGGEILATLSNPGAPNLALALSGRDVWRTTDGGATWQIVLENCMPQTGVLSTATRGIVVDAGGTVWVTLNGGADWAEVLYTSDFQTISADVIDTVIYLVDSTPPRILRSTNSGLTWQLVQVFANLHSIDRIAHIPSNPSYFWFTGHATSGDTLAYIYFAPAGGFVDTIVAGEVLDIQINSYNLNQILIATDRGIYQSNSPTGPWTRMNEPFAFGLFQPVDIEFTGNDSIVVSSFVNPGIFVGRRQYGIWLFSQVESREIGTYMSFGSPAILYCGSLGKGVYKSTDKGVSWQVCRNNLYAHTLISQGSASRIHDSTGYFIGLGGTPYRFRNWGASCDTLPKNFLLFGSAIEVAPTNPNLLIASAMNFEISGTTLSLSTIFRSTDAGENWQKVDSTYLPSDFLITSDPNIIIGNCDTFLIRSTSSGNNFTPVFQKPGFLSNLAGIDTIFVATYDSTFVSYNRGATWQALLGYGTGELAYDNTRKILYLTGMPIYRYNLNTGVFDSLYYDGLITDVAPDGNLYFLHYVPDTVFISRSFNGGNTIEQEVFPVQHWSGGLRAGNGGVYYYESFRGFWVSTDITHSISENKTPPVFTQFSMPTFIRKNQTAEIKFSLTSEANIAIVIYDISGRLMKRVYDGKIKSGEHTIQLTTERLSSGIYFVLLKQEQNSHTRKIIVY